MILRESALPIIFGGIARELLPQPLCEFDQVTATFGLRLKLVFHHLGSVLSLRTCPPSTVARCIDAPPRTKVGTRM
jgi:hypothetical protein